MPYDSATDEFWLDEEEKAWVTANTETWEKYLEDTAGNIKKLASRVSAAIRKVRVVTCIPSVYDPGRVATQRIKGVDYKKVELLLTWDNKVAALRGLQKGKRNIQVIDIAPDYVVFPDVEDNMVEASRKYNRVFMIGGGYWHRNHEAEK